MLILLPLSLLLTIHKSSSLLSNQIKSLSMEQERSKQKPQCKSALKRGRRGTMAAALVATQSSRRRRGRDIQDQFDSDQCGSEDESVEIERRVKALQRLVPGGENMEVDTLFEETAEYIEELRGKVMVMRPLADFIDAVAREKRQMGR